MKDDWYLGFTKDYNVEKARARFQQRFGYEPERVFYENWLLLLGPVKNVQISTIPPRELDNSWKER